MPKTTAQLRSEARSAEERLDLSQAASLYDAAADHYPGTRLGAKDQADIAALRERARQCRTATAPSASMRRLARAEAQRDFTGLTLARVEALAEALEITAAEVRSKVAAALNGDISALNELRGVTA